MYSAIDPRGNLQAFRELLALLTRHRQLTVEMARREIADRYAGQLLGGFWAVGHPLVLMAVYVFIFGYVFKVRVGNTAEMPLDYTVYLLSGLIPWLAFQESMSKASTVIVANASLVKQVVFPIEVLPVKGVMATLATQVIFLTLLGGYTWVSSGKLQWTYLLLPLLVLFQALAMVGVSFVLAAVGAYFRDVKDLVQVFSLVGVYLVPTFYLPSFVPDVFRALLYVNPFSHMVWSYQDVLYFGRLDHPWAWAVFALFSMGAFVYGYRLFRKAKTMLGNVL